MPRSKIHRGDKCGPCTLCNQVKFYYTHPAEWNSAQRQLLKELNPETTTASCICKACTLDIKRNIDNNNYHPRWVKNVTKCTATDCTSTKRLKLFKITSNVNVQQIIKLEPHNGTEIPLCVDHYNLVYRSIPEKSTLLAHVKCKVCSKELSKSDYHHCPDPKKIQNYLTETVGYEVDLSADDIVCLMCYKLHKAILEQGSQQSNDEDLVELIGELDEVDSSTPNESALLHITKHVAKLILRQDAILLPAAYDMYKCRLSELTHQEMSDCISTQHLFSHLKLKLGKHLACSMKVKSIGTLMYRNGGDLLTTVTKALSIERTRNLNKVTSANTDSVIADEEKPFEDLLSSVCTKMNHKLHQLARDLISDEKNGKANLTELDIDRFVKALDPNIWNMMLHLTRSRRDSTLVLHRYGFLPIIRYADTD